MADPKTEMNNGFGPIYKQRGSRASTACIVVLVVYVFINFFIEIRFEYLNPSQIYVYGFAFGVSFLVRLTGEVIRRLCLFAEEYRHVDSRYGGSLKKAFKTLFEFNNCKLIGVLAATAVIVAASIFSFDGLRWVPFTPHNIYVWLFMNVVFIPVLVQFVGLREPSKVEYSLVNESQNKNIADGLAWSFYFGYLKFVLPQLETQINLIKRFRYSIHNHKVFIVFPKNCQVSGTFSGPKDLVKDVGNLEPLKINQGGIRERTYEHTVYKIKDEKSGEEHLVVLEYATPLKVLYEMSNDPNAGLSREERDYQVVAFYSKVKEILDRDSKCKNRYELIVVSGKNDDIGRIIINALKNPAIAVD